MFATGVTMGLAELIIDDFCLVLVMATRCRSAQLEDVPSLGCVVQTSGSVGITTLQPALCPGHEDHFYLCHELRRLPFRCPDLSLTGELYRMVE